MMQLNKMMLHSKKILHNSSSTSKTTDDVCEMSLRWILAMRRNSQKHKYDISKISREDYPEIFGDKAGDFNHHKPTFLWTLTNALESEKMGLTAWLNTPRAYGFVYWLKTHKNTDEQDNTNQQDNTK